MPGDRVIQQWMSHGRSTAVACSLFNPKACAEVLTIPRVLAPLSRSE
jgi:hypothetical protein